MVGGGGRPSFWRKVSRDMESLQLMGLGRWVGREYLATVTPCVLAAIKRQRWRRLTSKQLSSVLAALLNSYQ